jgi:plasmid stabilization system protein ParE
MKFYTVITTEFAFKDLKLAQNFYENQAPQLGDYFFDALVTDIESLHIYAGIHSREFGYYKMLSKRFPYSIYYETYDDIARVIAILDQRQDPIHNYTQLNKRD